MLTRPLALNDSDDGGRGLVAVTSRPALPMTDEGDGDDDETQTGVFSPPAPPWSSSSSSPSSPPCSSSSSSAPSPTPPSFSSSSFLAPPPAPTSPPPPRSPTPSSTLPMSRLSPPWSSVSSSPPVAPSLLSTASSTPPLPPSVLFTPCSPPSSDFSPSSTSAPPITPSVLPPAPPPTDSPCVASAPFIYSSPRHLAPSSPPPSPPPSSSSSTSPVSNILALSSVSFPHSSHFFPLSSSSPPLPPLHHVCPSLLSPHSVHTPPPPSVSDSPAPPLFSSSNLFTPCIPHTSTMCPPLSSSSPSVPPSVLCPPPPPPFSHSPTAPSLLPPASPPCCPCSSLLPRLLTAHRLEVRRLLRGALASLGRRLDSLERRSRSKIRKKRGKQRGQEGAGAAFSSGSAVFSLSSTSSCRLAHPPPVTSSSSSSDSEDSPTLPLSSSLSQWEERRKRSREKKEEVGDGGGKRRRKNHRRREIYAPPENRDEDEEEKEDTGRFVGRMVVSFRAGAEGGEARLTLHNFNHRKHSGREGGGTGQSEKAVSVTGRNGFRAPQLLHSSSSSLPHNSRMLLLQSYKDQTCSQSEALSFSSGQWRFSDFRIPLKLSSSHGAFHLWLCSSSSSSFRPALMLQLSAVAVELMSESMRGGAYGNPLRPLKDWTAPPSLSSDHCYVQTPSPSPNFSPRRQLKQRANHSTRSFHLPRRRPLPLPLPSCSANGLSTVLPTDQSAAASELLNTNGERGKRVSQIRIRRAPPRETSLTPMGLPKVKRLKKKEFSLEEIYTNKNYKSPSTNRSLETIFEEPREKDGALLLIGHQRRRRLLLFPDFTQPRKRKRPQGVGLPAATMPRKRAAARRCHGGSPTDDESDLDVMLVERLSALEDFLTRQGLDV